MNAVLEMSPGLTFIEQVAHGLATRLYNHLPILSLASELRWPGRAEISVELAHSVFPVAVGCYTAPEGVVFLFPDSTGEYYTSKILRWPLGTAVGDAAAVQAALGGTDIVLTAALWAAWDKQLEHDAAEIARNIRAWCES